MDLAKTLWAENADLAQAALEHPFVQGLRMGTLPRQNFQSYIGVTTFFPPKIQASAPERSGTGLRRNVALLLEDGRSGVLTYFCSTLDPEVASRQGVRRLSRQLTRLNGDSGRKKCRDPASGAGIPSR